MTIADRLRRLEQLKMALPANVRAIEKLTEVLSARFERISPEIFSADWLRRQANADVLALALFGQLPRPDFLQDRLHRLSESKASSGLIAKCILEMVS